MATIASWTFSHLESGLVRLASDAGHVLDMHPAALLQMTASELLAMLERRAAEAAAPTPEPAQEPPFTDGNEGVKSDAGSAE